MNIEYAKGNIIEHNRDKYICQSVPYTTCIENQVYDVIDVLPYRGFKKGDKIAYVQIGSDIVVILPSICTHDSGIALDMNREYVYRKYDGELYQSEAAEHVNVNTLPSPPSICDPIIVIQMAELTGKELESYFIAAEMCKREPIQLKINILRDK